MNRIITVEVDCYMGMIARTVIRQAVIAISYEYKQ